jgi:hypothetical protein
VVIGEGEGEGAVLMRRIMDWVERRRSSSFGGILVAG